MYFQSLYQKARPLVQLALRKDSGHKGNLPGIWGPGSLIHFARTEHALPFADLQGFDISKKGLHALCHGEHTAILGSYDIETAAGFERIAGHL